MNFATTEERNAAFAAATPVERRKTVARDVLESLKARKYKATPMVYVKFRRGNFYTGAHYAFQLEQISGTCQVCAVGATFVSAVKLYNGSLGSFRDDVVRELFRHNQRNSMEVFFESGCVNGEHYDKIRPYSPRERMCAIMTSIVEHPLGYFVARRALETLLRKKPAREKPNRRRARIKHI